MAEHTEMEFSDVVYGGSGAAKDSTQAVSRQGEKQGNASGANLGGARFAKLQPMEPGPVRADSSAGCASTCPESLQRFITEGTPEAVIERYASLSRKAAASDFGEFDHNVVVLDVETTGLSLNHDELIQIAAARMENSEIVDWFVTFVNPGKPISDEIVHLTNISNEDVAAAPLPMDALAQLVNFVGDAKVVAHNAEFDRGFVTKHPAGYSLLENTWLDSLDMARIALPRMKSHRLIDLVKAFGGPLSTHRADDDVAATCVLFRILLAAIGSMPTSLVREIGLMATPQEWSTSVVFSYFARRKIAEEAAAAGMNAPMELGERHAAPDFERMGEVGASEYKIMPFSLRAMRRERLGSVGFRAKSNAADIVKDSARNLVFPAREDVGSAFSENGLMGRLYENYEARDEQRVMAEAVREAFEKADNLMVEAGTGVGKSMAYLVPSVMMALRNNITVGVATKTNALLDQLVYKELPALAAAFAEPGAFAGFENAAVRVNAPGENASSQAPRPPLTFAALKGFSHYPCLRRIQRIVSDGAKMKTIGSATYSQAPALAALLSYIEQTEYDDIDGLKIDYRTLPRRSITTTSHDCLRRKCPFYGTSCFVHGSRRRAEAADVVVTNHSLLFCDLAADGGLLPPIKYWVVDEAHGAENEARRAFSLELSADDLNSLAQRVSAEESTRNVFVRAERNVVVPESGESGTLLFALTNKAKSAGKEFAQAEEEFVAHMRDLLFFDPSKRKSNYEYVDLWLNNDVRASATFKALAEYGKTMVERSEKLVTACQELVGYLEDLEDAAVIQREIAAIAIELKDVIHAAEVILFSGTDTYVYSVSLCKKADRGGDKLEALLYNVGKAMNETLFDNTHSVVFASATLTVDDSFDSFEGALGLNASEESHCVSLLLESSYDFDAHMTVYVAKDMPEPMESRYLSELQRLLTGAHLAQQGSMLTLFTNRREMENCFEGVQPALKENDLRLVCQKWGVSVKGLRDDFLADEHLSLFALKSFWEGFDAPGATLKGVVIPKLPFAKPTDPLSCERAARDDAAWRRYVLPAAVLEVKQAAGRLIRKASDEGVLILADKRLITKGYGKSFLRSLPSKNVRVLSIDEIIAEIERRNR